MGEEWAAVLGGAALSWIGAERSIRSLCGSRAARGAFAFAARSRWRSFGLGAAVAAVAPTSEVPRRLPSTLVRTGTVAPAIASSLELGLGAAPLCAVALVLAVELVGTSAAVPVALALLVLGCALARVRLATAGGFAIGTAGVLGGAALVVRGSTDFAATLVELPWGWPAQLGASLVVGALVTFAWKTEGLTALVAAALVATKTADPFSAFAATLGARVTSAALCGVRDLRRDEHQRRAALVTIGAASAATVVGLIASAWAIAFDAHLPAAFGAPIALFGLLLTVSTLTSTAIVAFGARGLRHVDAAVAATPDPFDLELSPGLASSAARACIDAARERVKKSLAARIDGRAVSANGARRERCEIDAACDRLDALAAVARDLALPVSIARAIDRSQRAGALQRRALERTSRLVTDEGHERAAGSLAARVRQAKLATLSFVDACGDALRTGDSGSLGNERDNVHARLSATSEALTAVRPGTTLVNPVVTRRLCADLDVLGSIVDLELEAVRDATGSVGDEPGPDAAAPEEPPGSDATRAPAAAEPVASRA